MTRKLEGIDISTTLRYLFRNEQYLLNELVDRIFKVIKIEGLINKPVYIVL